MNKTVISVFNEIYTGREKVRIDKLINKEGENGFIASILGKDGIAKFKKVFFQLNEEGEIEKFSEPMLLDIFTENGEKFTISENNEILNKDKKFCKAMSVENEELDIGKVDKSKVHSESFLQVKLIIENYEEGDTFFQCLKDSYDYINVI